VPRLFRTEVATADNRGTGLGLPSCALFCETAGGYIRLDVTRQQDAMGRNGFTRFVFGISGQLVRADRRASAARADNLARRQDYVELVAVASPPAALKAAPADPKSLPDNVAVVVVDDSALNRKCAVRSLQRCQAASGANDWEYSQFETFEAAQPFLLKMHEADKLVVVCVDENMDSRGGVMTGTMGVSPSLAPTDAPPRSSGSSRNSASAASSSARAAIPTSAADTSSSEPRSIGVRYPVPPRVGLSQPQASRSQGTVALSTIFSPPLPFARADRSICATLPLSPD